jgi:hypothetical protein
MSTRSSLSRRTTAKRQKYVYYDGCSNGGREGMMEAQMFPQDFNGIIIGGVAQWWTHAATEQLFASINLQNAGIQGSTGTTLLNLTQSAATASCDALDGVVDGLITDPRRCHWDPNSLICQPGQNTNCLTPAQAAAIKANIQAMQDPNTGTWLYSGESRGSEFDQLRFSANVGYAAFGVANYELAHQNLNWNPATFNMDTDLPVLDNALGIYNALNPNLQPFEQAGGRLIEWHEWDDYAFTPEGIIKYYGQVIDQTGQGDLNAVQSFYRLFMLPGVGHCTGTTDIGPDNIGAENQTAVSPDPQHDIVSALEAWVEQGVAPANLIATKFVNNDPTQAIQMQRPVCPYPQQAIYSGSGNTNVASNFYCGRLYGYTLSAHDFDGDGKSDVLWRDTSSNVGMWLMGNNGTTISQAQVLGNVTAIWAAIGQRDFNSDDNADVLWRDSSGNVGFWLMNGTHIMSTTVLGNVPTNWSVVGTSDFNRDGNADILWRDANTGAVAIGLMSGSQVLHNGSFVNVGPQLVQSVNLGTVPNNWTVAGTDGLGTIIWRDSNSGTVGIWLTDGLHITQTVTLGAVPSNWTIAGVGDFDGNGSADILWRDTSGNVGMWLMNGTQIMQTTVLGNVPLIWTIAATGDYAGSGTSGILWTDNTGNVGVWFMNGTTVSSTKVYGNVGTTWSVQSLNAD